MAFLYHRVPDPMQGTMLYPLNQLKEKLPSVYRRAIEKYAGREQSMEEIIPVLNCLWNDVLFFTAVHPSEIKQALIEAGYHPDFTLQYFQIDPHAIQPDQSIVYLYPESMLGAKHRPEDFVLYRPEDVEQWSVLPTPTKEYYKQEVAKGERPLAYHRVPHILYKGIIDTTNVPIISV